MKLTSYAGLRAVVTGASSGIGEALAHALLARGARVAVVARRRERLAKLASGAAERGSEALAIECDVADPGQVASAHRQVEARFGGVDLLVNNAGFGHHSFFTDLPLAEIERMLRTNVLGALAWAQAVIPGMRAQRRGWIANLSSLAGLIPQPDESVYGATKAAITSWSQAIAAELAPSGISVIAVHPALVRTEMFTPNVVARLPAGLESQFLEPQEFAERVLRALERGQRSVVIPARFGAAVKLQALFPALFGRAVARTKLAGLRTAQS